MKIIDFKFDEETGQNNFCISSGEAWKLIPTKFEYDWLDESKPAFLKGGNDFGDRFRVYNYIKYVKKLGFKLTKRASEQMRYLSDYFQKRFNLYITVAEINSKKQIIKRGYEYEQSLRVR